MITYDNEACFSLRVLIRHDSMDPGEITRMLEIEPTKCWKAGERIVTPTGKVLESIYNHTSWSRWRDYTDRKSLSSEFHALVDELASVSTGLTHLARKGCDIVVVIDLSGEDNMGIVFSNDDLRRLQEFNVELGLEVFPEGV